MSLIFELRLDKERYHPGDRVAGTVVVVEGGRSRRLQVHLEYLEETASYLECATSVSTRPLHEGDLLAGESFRFDLVLPPDALPNHESTHGQLYWRLDVKSDELGFDSHEQRRIDVTV